MVELKKVNSINVWYLLRKHSDLI